MIDLLLAVAFGLAIGVLLGSIGGGGSILTVPVLVYLLGKPAHEATATSLIIVGLTALVGVVLQARAGGVDFRTGALVGTAGIPGAITGTWLNSMVSGALLLGLFGLLMVIVAVLMVTRKLDDTERARPRVIVLAATGLSIGILTGFFGVGGGFLIVPALVMLASMPMRSAVGTSLLVIVINAVAGTAANAPGVLSDVPLALAFVAGGTFGSIAGTRIGSAINDVALRTGFAIFTAGLGVVLIAVNGWQLRG